MITTCAGCYKTFKELYPKHSHFDIEVLHIVEYLEKLISEEKLKFQKPYAMKIVYHDPCDLGRHMNIYEPPRKILQAIPGVQFLEFKENRSLAKCCGGGGGLKAYNNDLSGEIAYPNFGGDRARSRDYCICLSLMQIQLSTSRRKTSEGEKGKA